MVFLEDRRQRVRDADAAPARQPPVLHVFDTVNEGARLALAAQGRIKADIERQPPSPINGIFECLQKATWPHVWSSTLVPPETAAAATILSFRFSPTSGVRDENLAWIRDHLFSDSNESF